MLGSDYDVFSSHGDVRNSKDGGDSSVGDVHSSQMLTVAQ
jgi:hypothetical protein